ncbi:stromal membrane-associated protein 1 isoform X2 [Arapaima gigas]
MTTRSEREKAQKLNEQHQAILAKMLREEDNKYCADCEAKGPRWASWNLGVFICIRCAGIHRNLGVHISRVKSVNLDQWTPEQIQSVQEMGNTRARQLYEANLPESFRRPQTDQAVEFFIRDKYERKKYYDKNAASRSNCQKRDEIQRDSKASPMKNAEPAIDLLGLDTPAVSSGNGSKSTAPLSDDLDIFGPMVSNPLPSSSAQPSTAVTTGAPATAAASASGTAGGSPAPTQGELDLFSESTGKAEDTTKKPLSKDSILSLYSTSGIAQQPTPAGMFMGASQMQFPAQPPSGFQGFPGMGTALPPTTMMGAVMSQGGTMMGQNAGMMVGMTMPNGFMGGVPAGVMSLAPGMMGPQGGAMPAGVVPAQNMYTMQPGQQGQWTMNQVNQQMSSMSLNGTGGGAAVGFGQSGTWAGPPSGQTLSTQLWNYPLEDTL